MKNRPKILSIAGYDASAGAGVLADVKTFEQNKTLGMAVITANTIQNENEFIAVNWLDEQQILEQLHVLLKVHHFAYVKIGLIPSLSFLEKLIAAFEKQKTKFIWDPILSASAGFNFKHDLSTLENILPQLFLITPNWEEAKLLSQNNNALQGAEKLATLTKVFLKGGHNDQNKGKDFLFAKEKMYPLNPKGRKVSAKHGSGCVFSSALAANLAKGFPLVKACFRSKEYVTKVLESNTSLLGYHK